MAQHQLFDQVSILIYLHTHTHAHTHRERERESEIQLLLFKALHKQVLLLSFYILHILFQ